MQPASYTNGKYGENRLLRQKVSGRVWDNKQKGCSARQSTGGQKRGTGRYGFEPVVENDGTDNANA
jgi:hypothetical protein